MRLKDKNCFNCSTGELHYNKYNKLDGCYCNGKEKVIPLSNTNVKYNGCGKFNVRGYVADKIHIFVAEEIDTKLTLRYTIEDLFNTKVNHTKRDIVMDFKDVDYIGPSCAQEYIYQKTFNSVQYIEEINMDESVSQMFEIVHERIKNGDFDETHNLRS